MHQSKIKPPTSNGILSCLLSGSLTVSSISPITGVQMVASDAIVDNKKVEDIIHTHKATEAKMKFLFTKILNFNA